MAQIIHPGIRPLTFAYTDCPLLKEMQWPLRLPVKAVVPAASPAKPPLGNSGWSAVFVVVETWRLGPLEKGFPSKC